MQKLKEDIKIKSGNKEKAHTRVQTARNRKLTRRTDMNTHAESNVLLFKRPEPVLNKEKLYTNNSILLVLAASLFTLLIVITFAPAGLIQDLSLIVLLISSLVLVRTYRQKLNKPNEEK